jgi:hypothetical protein
MIGSVIELGKYFVIEVRKAGELPTMIEVPALQARLLLIFAKFRELQSAVCRSRFRGRARGARLWEPEAGDRLR